MELTQFLPDELHLLLAEHAQVPDPALRLKPAGANDVRDSVNRLVQLPGYVPRGEQRERGRSHGWSCDVCTAVCCEELASRISAR